MLNRTLKDRLARFFFAVALILPAFVHAAVGLTQIAGPDDDGPVTVYYPSSAQAQPLARGPFTLDVAWDGAPVRGNGRLVVISHGSGGSPWVHADLARTLVEQGFVVALPEHNGDNYKDFSKAGPESWKRRPVEVSHAIDVVGRDPRFAALLALDKVGMYGMSAGGHTALTLAGGRWSPKRLKEHCEAHIAETFNTCVGLSGRLTGGFFDGWKTSIALWIIRHRLTDETWYTHNDPRVAAVVAGVPFAVDFDMASLEKPRAPLALVTAQKDKWLPPRFHSQAVLDACKVCEHLADFPTGGHGALLSPPPPGLFGLAGELLNDPPGFDRSTTPEVDRKIAAFFRKHLLPQAAAPSH
ncbi:MAG: alpha/beta hydrolase family protein [Sulfurifustaceae bacterium]